MGKLGAACQAQHCHRPAASGAPNLVRATGCLEQNTTRPFGRAAISRLLCGLPDRRALLAR